MGDITEKVNPGKAVEDMVTSLAMLSRDPFIKQSAVLFASSLAYGAFNYLYQVYIASFSGLGRQWDLWVHLCPILHGLRLLQSHASRRRKVRIGAPGSRKTSVALAFTRSLLAKVLAAGLLGFRLLYVALPWVWVFLKIQPGNISLILGILVVISTLMPAVSEVLQGL